MSIITTSPDHNFRPGDVITINGKKFTVSDAGPTCLIVEPIGVFARLRSWARRLWPFRFSGFWSRVWTR